MLCHTSTPLSVTLQCDSTESVSCHTERSRSMTPSMTQLNWNVVTLSVVEV